MKTELKGEWKEGWTEEQFIYKTRKKAFGKFKKDFWDLPQDVKEPMPEDLEKKFRFLFEQLGVFGTKEVVNKYVKPVKIYKKREG